MDLFQGQEQCISLGRPVQKRRVIDNRSDRYIEHIVDPLTGKVLRDVDEPLSAHQGHGSAKTRKKETRWSRRAMLLALAAILIAVAILLLW